MDEAERQKLAEKAKRLEEKMLFVKAGEVYLSLSMQPEAAGAFEKGGDYTRAAALFRQLGREEDARRCEEKRDGASGKSWLELQSEFQQDKGNPY
jgi:hypothetical protein